MNEIELKRFEGKVVELIGRNSYEAWFGEKPAVMDGGKVKFEARYAAKIYSPFYGILVIKTHSKFFKDKIVSRFGSQIQKISQELGYKRLHILAQGEEIPRAEPS